MLVGLGGLGEWDWEYYRGWLVNTGPGECRRPWEESLFGALWEERNAG